MKKTLILLIGLMFSMVLSAQDSRMSIYGYFDLEAEVNNRDAKGKIWTFDQHHFNVITTFQLDERFRIFSEIEWEHGVEIEDGEGSGLVAMERAWLEYKYTDALRFKFGKMLTPFGLYNLKHDATPTFLSSFLPNAVYGEHANPLGNSQRLYGKFATGIQVLGIFITDSWSGEYHVFVSNGSGPKPAKQDNNTNKAVGGMVRLSPGIIGFTIGSSYYNEKNGNAMDTRQSALSLDMAFTQYEFLIELEGVMAKQETVNAQMTPTGNYVDILGYYGQTAYTILDMYTPFFRYEVFDPNTNVDDDAMNTIVAGLNISVTPRVYLKGEVQLNRFQNKAIDGYERFVTSVAVAF